MKQTSTDMEQIGPDMVQISTDLGQINANDRTVEGLDVKGRPAFTIQYHPEACPGPHDANPLFDRFADLIANDLEVKANAKTR